MAYASDMNMLSTAMRPHRVEWQTPGLQPGYELLGRLIRPAMVVVAAKGSTGAAAEPTGGPANPYAANDASHDGDDAGGAVDTKA